MPALLSFAVGYLSLSLEILWMRLFGFANHSKPQSFSFILAVFLIGIALGAYLGKYLCKRPLNLWRVSGIILVISGIADLISPWLYAYFAYSKVQIPSAGILVALTAALKALIFPIAHHMGANTASATLGKRISTVYVANIIGATLGPIAMIGILSALSTQQSFIFCGSLTLFVAGLCLWQSLSWTFRFAYLSMMFVSITLLSTLESHLLIAKVAIKGNLLQIIENPYGIVSTYAGGKGGDYVTGGNVYDGRTNLNPVINTNGIHRIIIMSVLHDKPRHVLMIGLSIGSWLKLVTSFPEVERIDVVEINPGYLQAMRKYPQQFSAIADKRVHIHIDDGRRWLKINKNERFDIIIMNTTYYWRAYITALLSQDFLKIVKQHMNPGAILMYNATGLPDVLKTANQVFKHAYFYENFVFASDEDWRVKLQLAKSVSKLSQLMLDGKPLFPANSEALIKQYLSRMIVPLAVMEPIYEEILQRKLEVITDKNLINEYKYGAQLTNQL